MPAVITLIIAIFLILISWTWHNLGNIENKRKIFTIVGLLLVSFLVTLVIFNISKKDIFYDFQAEMESVRTVLVTLFTIINGLIIMPAIAKIIGKVNDKEIKKEQANKRLAIIIIVFIIILFVECGYLKNIQQGILNIYSMKK